MKETEILMKKELPISLQKCSIQESFLIVYEIVDEILEQKWEIELSEKFSKENARGGRNQEEKEKEIKKPCDFKATNTRNKGQGRNRAKK